MKRYFQKGITAVMTMALLTSLVACGGKKDNSSETSTTDTTNTNKTNNTASTETTTTDNATSDTEAEVTDVPEEEDSAYTVLTDENGNTYDLGGMEIIIADWWSAETPAEPTTAQEEATQEYRDWIQETYNFKIRALGIDGWGEHPETFINFATTGGDENYVFQMYASSLAAPMASGLFYDLATLDCFDFTEDKWDEATKNLMTKGGSIYGMRSEKPEPRGGVFFNKRVLEEAGVEPESLYDMQADGTWTWDAFEELCAKLTRDTDNDGVVDTYALTSFSTDFFHSVIASNNATYVDIDADGKYFNAMRSDEFLEAANWGQEILTKYEMPQPADSAWDYAYSSFRNAEAAMIVAEEYKVGDLKEMEDDFGFVAFPKGPNADNYTNVYSDNVAVIPACYDADRAWKIAFAYNLYTNPTPGYEDVDDWKTNYYPQFRDARAVDETLEILRNNGVTWVLPLISGLGYGDFDWKAYPHDQTATEIIDTIWDQWQAYIDEANAK